MADFTARIKPKKSSTAGEVPQAADLEVAELAVNTADGKLFVKHTDDSIKEISGGGGATTIDDLTDVDTSTAPPTTGQVLKWDGANWTPAADEIGTPTPPSYIDGYLNADSTADTSHVLNAPTHQEGDLLIAIMMWRGNGLPITPPADWSLHGSYITAVTAGPSQGLYVYTKTATASEPATYTWTGSASTRNCGAIVATRNGIIESVDEYVKAATGTGAIDVTCTDGYVNVIAHEWVYAGSSGETATMTGSNVQQLSFSSITERRLMVGYATLSGTVSCSHSSSDDTANSAGVIVINVKPSASGASIDSLTDVDTSTVAPTDGQVLTWSATNNKWEPATLPVAPYIVGFDGAPASNFNTATPSVTVPTGVQSGDIIVVALMHRSGIPSTLTDVPAPSGFTRILSQEYSSTSGTTSSAYIGAYTKVADGTESGTALNFAGTISDTGDDWNWTIQVWRNVGSVGTPLYQDTMPSPGGLGPTWYTVEIADNPLATYAVFVFNLYSYSTNGMMYRIQPANGGSCNHLVNTWEPTSGKRGHYWWQSAGVFRIGTHNSVDPFAASVAGLTDGLHIVMVPLLPA